MPSSKETDLLLPQASSSRHAWRSRVYDVLEGHRWEKLSIALISINVAAYLCSTDSAIAAQWQWTLDLIEVSSVAIFSAEYVLRFWTVVEEPETVRSSCAMHHER